MYSHVNSSCASTRVYDPARIQGDFSKTLHIQAWYLHGVLEGAEVAHLSAKHKITQLCVREKDDEEHDCKSTNVFGALRKRNKTNKVSLQTILHCASYFQLQFTSLYSLRYI